MPGRCALSAHGARKLIVKTDRQTETEKDTYAKLSSVCASVISRSVNTNPKDHMMCLPYSNWYPASFCLEAIECTDQG
jgi:hypothetical protein